MPWIYEPGLPGARIAGTVVDAGNKPVSGARVELRPVALVDLAMESPSVLSDASGHFDFGAQPPTVYTVLAAHTAYGPGGTSVDLADPTEIPRPDDLKIELPECKKFTGDVVDAMGKPLAGVDVLSYGQTFGAALVGESGPDGRFDLCVGTHALFVHPGYASQILPLWWAHGPAHIILVEGARVEGTVVDTDGVPVAGALVVNKELAMLRDPIALTDASGRFELLDLPSRSLTLDAEHAEHGRSYGTRVMAAAGRTSEVLIELTERCRRVSGRVVSAGRPIGGVRLLRTVSQLDGSFVARCVAPERARIRVSGWVLRGSDEVPDGREDIDDLLVEVHPGAVVRGLVLSQGKPVADAAIIKENGYSTIAESNAQGRFELKGLEAGSFALRASHRTSGRRSPYVAVELSQDGQADITLDLSDTGSISGVVLGSDGRPLIGATVEVVEPGIAPMKGWRSSRRGPDARVEQREARTDPSGAFEFWGLTAERYEVRTKEHASPSPWPVVQLAPSEARKDIQLIVTIPGIDSIAGHVRRPSGAAIAGAVVGVRLGSLRVTTDESGAFRLDADGFRDPLWIEVVTPDGVQRTLDVPRGKQDVEIAIAEAGRLDVIVEGTGENWDASVTPRSETSSSRYGADVRGHTFSVQHLDPGRYDVKVEGPGGAGSELVDIEEGKTTKAVIKIGAPATVRGRARRFPDGIGVADLRCSNGPIGSPVRTDRDGGFELTGVNPGRVGIICGNVSFTSPKAGTPIGLATVHIRAGEKAVVDVWIVTPPEHPANLGMEIKPAEDRLLVELTRVAWSWDQIKRAT